MSRAGSGKAPRSWTAEHQLGVEMASLVFALAHQMAARTEAVASEFGLTGAQARVLLQLSEPVAMGKLAESLDCNASNVTGLVDRLHARGLVERQPTEADRRVKRLTLTASGEGVRAELEDRLFAGRPLLAQLSQAEQRTLRSLLRQALGEADDRVEGAS